MLIYNPPPSVTPFQLDTVSGVLDGSITGNYASLSGWTVTSVATQSVRLSLFSGTLTNGLTATGAALGAQALSLSGALQAQIVGGVAGVVTLNGLAGVLSVAGKGGLSVTTAGTTIFVSGDIPVTQAFTTAVPLGVSSVDIVFPLSFATVPKVVPAISTTGGYTYLLVPQSPTTTGYSLLLSDIVAEPGVTITTIAQLS